MTSVVNMQQVRPVHSFCCLSNRKHFPCFDIVIDTSLISESIYIYIFCIIYTGEPDEVYQEKEKVAPRTSEQLQEEEYMECLKETKDKEEEEHARANNDECIEPKSIRLLSESRIKTEQDPPSPRKEKENINVSFPSSEVSLAKPKETLKETIFQGKHSKTETASKLQSDSEDEDIEKWFEQMYNDGNVTHTEKEERKIRPQIASLDEGLCDVHQNSKPHPQNTKTKIHPEIGTVCIICLYIVTDMRYNIIA